MKSYLQRIEELLQGDITLEAKYFKEFYRVYGIRTQSMLISPKVSPISAFEMPLESVAHHFSFDDVLLGPEPKGSVYATNSGRVLIEHIAGLHDPVGKPLPAPGANAERLARDYHRRVKVFRPAQDFERSLRDNKTLVVENYALLNKLYRYQLSVYSNIYKWTNILRAAFFNIGKKVVLSDRQHYVFLELPAIIPDIVMLNQSSGAITAIKREFLEVFSKPEALLILELWKWMGKPIKQKVDGKETVGPRPSIFDYIAPEQMAKVNLVWMDNGNWILLNLGTFIELSKMDKGEELEGSNTVQRRFLRMLIMLMSQRVDVTDTAADIKAENDALDSKEDVVETKQVVRDALKSIATNPYDDSDIPNLDALEDEQLVDVDDVKTSEQQQLDEEVEIQKDLDMLRRLNERKLAPQSQSTIIEVVQPPKSPIERLHRKIEDKAEKGELTAAEYRRAKKLYDNMLNLDNPFGEGKLQDFTVVSDELKQITEEESVKHIKNIRGVVDKSMLKSRVDVFDKKYVTQVMERHIAATMLSVQGAGLIATDLSVEEVVDVGNRYKTLRLRVSPLDGDGSTIVARIPVVDEEGTFLANGTKWRMKKQKADIPIRKTSPVEVALTTYYAKAFVHRSVKSVVNYPKWLNRQINLMEMADDGAVKVTQVKRINTFTNEVTLPRIYTTLAMSFKELTIDKDLRIFVDYNHRFAEFGQAFVEAVEREGFVFAGTYKGNPMLVDFVNMFYVLDKNELVELGSFESLLKVSEQNVPTEVAEFSLFTRQVPVGIILGYRYGLTNLLGLLNVPFRRVLSGQQLNLAPNEFAIRFSDETLVVSRADKKAELILAGLNRYHASIKHYTMESFNNSDVFVNVLEENGFRIGFVRELDLAFDMFVDPVSADILTSMNEPITLEELLLRSCELLTTDAHPDEVDEYVMRYRGYERFAGHLYKELVTATRQFRSRGIGKAAKLSMNPEAVWQSIIGDSSCSPIEESNPVQNTKEKDIFTFGGTGGRSTRSMVKRTRAYHKNSVGIVSEASTDSGSVGVNAYLAANALLTDVTGRPDQNANKTLESSNLFSTTALLSPCIEHDDAKRIVFANIQYSHAVACSGYEVSPFRTGEEKAIAHRVGSLFAGVAEDDGVVIDVSDHSVVVEYKSGEKKSFEIGTRFGNVTGTTVPHRLVTDLSVGDKVDVGDVVTFNQGFFKRDRLDKRQCMMMPGVLAKVAILEKNSTFEDACVISPRLAGLFKTELTEIRYITVRFDQQVNNLVRVGAQVDLESILCTIEDAVTADNDLFTADNLDLLTTLAAQAPSANVKGRVEHIEVLYHGDVEDMGESIRKLAEESDKQRKRKAKQLNEPVVTGAVDSSIKVNKQPVELDTAVIKIYITKEIEAGYGDKGVLGNQMKTIISDVMIGEHVSQRTNTPIDIYFSYLSIAARIVGSPELIGTTITLLKLMSPRVADAYFE